MKTASLHKLFPLAAILMIAFMTSARLQAQDEEESDSIYGFTSIDYDSSSNQITAYSETDADNPLDIYYWAELTLDVKDQHGNVLATAYGSSDYSYSDATITLAANPSTTYTATGSHWVELSETFTCPGCSPNGYEYYDPFEMGYYSDYYAVWPNIADWMAQTQTPQQNGLGYQELILGATNDTAQVTTPGKCGDVRDTMIQEYLNYHVALTPVCISFTQSVFSFVTHFTFGEMNSGDYNWAILTLPLQDGIENTRTDYGNQSLTVNSGYRNPAHQCAIDAGAGRRCTINSSHVMGAAVDFASNSGTWAGIAAAGKAATACTEPEVQSGSGHVHLDWRRSPCPYGW